MDPVSQTEASESLAKRGLSVVGWYHSHPTFAASPSIRDIDTQAKFQVMLCYLFGSRGHQNLILLEKLSTNTLFVHYYDYCKAYMDL